MTQAYLEKESVQHVADKCMVSRTTALRYKEIDNWDARRASIVKKTNERLDDSAARTRARHVRLAQLVQVRTSKQIINEDVEIPLKVAVPALLNAIKLEREIIGQDIEGRQIQITVTLPADLEDM